jgi:phage tail sheath protein FI
MPTSPTWPGVYVEEVPSGVRSIVGIATAVAAFVGRTARGPTTVPITCTSWGDFQRQCGGRWTDSEVGAAVEQFFTNGGGQAVVARAVGAGTLTARCDLGGVVLDAADPGAWGGSLRATVDHGTPGTPSAIDDDATFHLTLEEIHDGEVTASEVHLRVSAAAGAARGVATVLAARSVLARVAAAPTGRPAEVAAKPFTFSGQGAMTPDGQPPDTAALTAALDLLEQADLVNLVCVPPPDPDTDTSVATWAAATAWCERHRAVLLVDPPSTWGSAQAAADLAGGYDSLRSPNVAFHFPRLVAGDPLRAGVRRPFPPAGAVAGLLARTDAERGVWKSPAGADADLRGFAGPELELTPAEIGVVNGRGVNALRSLDVAGTVAWGARTARGADTMASEWKYLAVRRTALHIEESLFRGTTWAVFEPNRETLWTELRLAVGSFLHDLFRQGAFAGTTPREAYSVRCDSTTTTQADIDRGTVNILVGFAPLKPAEFVVLAFQQVAGQASD